MRRMDLKELLIESQQALAQQDYVRAKAGFTRLAQIPAFQNQAWLHLCQIELLSGRFNEALSLTQQAVSRDPQSALLQHFYATCLQWNKQLPKAIELYRQALESRLAEKTMKRALSPNQTFNQVENEKILWQTLVLLADKGIYAFATAGTLLGLTRDKQLLAGDKDIDIGLPFEQMDAAMLLLLQAGWRENDFSYGLANPRCFKHPSGLVLDLCGYATDLQTGGVISGMWYAEVSMEWNRITDYPVPQWIQITTPYGRCFHLGNADEFLTALYGDWRTPCASFDTIIEARNLRGFSLLTQCFAYSRLFSHWQRGQLAKAQKICTLFIQHYPEDALLTRIHCVLAQAIEG